MSNSITTWPEYPYDPKRKARVPIDDVLVQIMRSVYAADWNDQDGPNWQTIRSSLHAIDWPASEISGMTVAAIRQALDMNRHKFQQHSAPHTTHTGEATTINFHREAPALRPDHIKILRALRQLGVTTTQEQIARHEGIEISERTISTRLTELRGMHFVHRPAGPKAGDQITSLGIACLDNLRK